MTKRIGILTSGGDCAGLNAVIRAVVCARHPAMAGGGRHPPRHAGLLRGRSKPSRSTRRGSTRHAAPGRHHPRHHQQGRPVRLPDGRRQPAATARPRSSRASAQLRLDALIGIGGDGSLADPAPAGPQGGIPGRHPQDDRQRRRPHRGVGRLRRRSRSPPRRSTGCSRRPPATAASWCSR